MSSNRWQRTRTKRPVNRPIQALSSSSTPIPSLKKHCPRKTSEKLPSLTDHHTEKLQELWGVISPSRGDPKIPPKLPQTVVGSDSVFQLSTSTLAFLGRKGTEEAHNIKLQEKLCVWTAHKHRTPAGTGEKDQVRKVITKGFTFIQPQEGMSSLVTDSNMTQKCHLAEPAL